MLVDDYTTLRRHMAARHAVSLEVFLFHTMTYYYF